MSLKVKGQQAGSYIILLLLAVNSSLQAGTVKIILETLSVDNIVQADGITPLPEYTTFNTRTFVADPDSNRPAIAALLSSGSPVTNLNDSSIILALDPTHHRSKVAGIWLTK